LIVVEFAALKTAHQQARVIRHRLAPVEIDRSQDRVARTRLTQACYLQHKMHYGAHLAAVARQLA